jgi:KDO2-lipid IV(A) lauroyltransferase
MKKMSLFKKIRFLTEYVFLRLIGLIITVMPYGVMLKLAEGASKICTKIIRKRFNLTIDNIKKVFPAKPQKQVKQIALQSWQNIAQAAVEIIKTTRYTRKQMLEKCRFENMQQLTNHLNSGKGALLHLGHLANWEIIAQTLPLFGFKTAAIARHIRNPHLDNWITQVRQRFGMEIIGHRNPFFSCVKKLKKGYLIGILMDQNMPANAIFTPFLGRMAATTPLTALLSLKTQTPIFPLQVTRQNDGAIRAVFEAPIVPDKTYSEENVYKLTDALNHRLETWIRQTPHLWLWVHNRWKREKDAPKQREKIK